VEWGNTAISRWELLKLKREVDVLLLAGVNGKKGSLRGILLEGSYISSWL
jgi:hypothetical protein